MSNQILGLIFLFFTAVTYSAPPNHEVLDISEADVMMIKKIINGKVPQGKFKGKTLNTAVRRPLYVIGSGENNVEALADRLQKDSVLVANFYHNNEFYIARIPVGNVNSVVLLTAPFSRMASHTMLRFVIDEGARVELVAKIESLRDNKDVNIKILENPILLRDMVYSIDGTEPRGQGGWNMKDAIAGSYTIARRMVSVQERFRWFIAEGTPINQVELNINREMSQHLVRRGIEMSQMEIWSRGYHLLCANCTNLAIRLVKNNVSYEERSSKKSNSLKLLIQEKLDPLLKFLEPFTQFTYFNLKVLGWLGKKRIDLQNEPEFRSEIMEVVQELRTAIEKNIKYSEAQKQSLFRSLGIDSNLQILNNPAPFSAALKSFKATMVESKNKLSCIRAYSF